MKPMKTILATVVMGFAASMVALPVMAETPANMLVIANRIDDITTLDPAESFEFEALI